MRQRSWRTWRKGRGIGRRQPTRPLFSASLGQRSLGCQHLGSLCFRQHRRSLTNPRFSRYPVGGKGVTGRGGGSGVLLGGLAAYVIQESPQAGVRNHSSAPSHFWSTSCHSDLPGHRLISPPTWHLPKPVVHFFSPSSTLTLFPLLPTLLQFSELTLTGFQEMAGATV